MRCFAPVTITLFFTLGAPNLSGRASGAVYGFYQGVFPYHAGVFPYHAKGGGR